jgi:hypothetical protein
MTEFQIRLQLGLMAAFLSGFSGPTNEPTLLQLSTAHSAQSRVLTAQEYRRVLAHPTSAALYYEAATIGALSGVQGYPPAGPAIGCLGGALRAQYSLAIDGALSDADYSAVWKEYGLMAYDAALIVKNGVAPAAIMARISETTATEGSLGSAVVPKYYTVLHREPASLDGKVTVWLQTARGGLGDFTTARLLELGLPALDVVWGRIASLSEIEPLPSSEFQVYAQRRATIFQSVILARILDPARLSSFPEHLVNELSEDGRGYYGNGAAPGSPQRAWRISLFLRSPCLTGFRAR